VTRGSILIVEDNPLTRKALRLTLEAEGFSVLEAGDGAAAIALTGAGRPALILQDLVLPDLDGIELVQRLRELDAGRDIPIIACSGLLSKIDEARSLRVGFTDYLFKPVERARLLEVIGGYLPAAAADDRPGRGRRVLLIDDDAVQRKLNAIQLRQLGFAVTTAVDTLDALAKIWNDRPDAIICDLLMPGESGLDLCVTLRRDPLLAAIPVIVVSASFLHIENDDLRMAREMGANALVPRTPDLGPVVDALREALAADAAAPPPVANAEDIGAEYARRLTRQLAHQAKLNAALTRRAARDAAQLAILAGAAQVMAGRQDLGQMLEDVLARALDAGGTTLGAIYLLDRAGRLTLACHLGVPRGAIDGLDDFFGHRALLDEAARGDSAMRVPAAEIPATLASALKIPAGAMALAITPLVSGGTRHGAMMMTAGTQAFDESWLASLTAVGTQLGQAIALAQTVAELAASETRYRVLFERNVAGVFTATPDGRVVACNDAFARIFGYDAPAAMAGVPLADLVHDDTRHLAVLERLAAGDVIHNTTLLGRRADDAPVRILLSAGVIRDPGGDTLHGTVVDDTERQRLEEQLRQAQKVEALGTLAGGVAHDFNNILAAILGHAELARSEITSPTGTEDLDVILHATERGRQLVQRILSFSRRQTLVRRALVLRAVVDEALALLRTTLPPTVSLRAKLDDRGPQVLADATAVEQVILNLATNAWHAMPNGGTIEIGVEPLYVRDHIAREHPELREGMHMVVSVRDTGTGMDAAVRARAFEPFFTTKPPGTGTGLGLAMVHGIMRQHDGAVELESEPGRGTTVRCFFPAVLADDADMETAAATVARGRGERILLVEDEPWLATIGKRLLGRLGYTVSTEVDPERAISQVRAQPGYFDGVIVDYWMPGLTGVELARELTRITPGLPILMLTGFIADLPADVLAEAGIRRTLRKPAPAAELAAALRAVLGRRP
jgi:two-component system, cell cycle sensor histidine kinase and response regulator CckA